jgi:hypothetical protein
MKIMKTKTLLFSLAISFATCMNAQTDVTPANWKFSAKTIGPAGITTSGGIIIQSECSIDQLSFPVAATDVQPGSIVLFDWDGSGQKKYAAMTTTQQERMDAFIAGFNIVNGGTLGNILCYQGVGSTNTRPGSVKNTKYTSAPSIDIFSHKFTESGTYLVTLSIRTIQNTGASTTSISGYVANAYYEQLNSAGTSNPIGFNISCDPAFNSSWTTVQYEFTTSPFYSPVVCKLGLPWDIANNSILLINSISIVKETDPTLGGVVKITYPAFDDTPVWTGIKNNADDNKFIVWGANNVINVVDAKSPVEVFTTAGQLIGKAVNGSTVTKISVPVKGTYLVKVGNQTRKVVL